MADVKWIKITTDIFDDEKILLIESLPDSYAIITVWFKLLCLAGKQNNSGVFMMGRIAYTDKMLATIFRMKESTVTMALNTFEQFGMVKIANGVYTIPNWEKHQNLDKLEQAREQTRQRVARHRAKQKQLAECNASCNADVTPTDKDIDKDKDIDIYKENIREKTDFQSVIDLFHNICISFPKIRSLTDARKKAIKARLNTYKLDDFKTLFENAEASSFLKGRNDRNWTATFDWLIKDANMAKVLEGNYADKGRQEKLPGWYGCTGPGKAEMEAMRKLMEEDEEDNDPEVAAQIEAMKQKMQEKYGKSN